MNPDCSDVCFAEVSSKLGFSLEQNNDDNNEMSSVPAVCQKVMKHFDFSPHRKTETMVCLFQLQQYR